MRFIAAASLFLFAACSQPGGRARHPEEPVLGKYEGAFMGSPLELEINARRGDSVFGFSRHKDQVRPVAGTSLRGAAGYHIALMEPGDSPYDGRFNMELDTVAATLTGSWTPQNNPELTETSFMLKRKEAKTP